MRTLIKDSKSSGGVRLTSVTKPILQENEVLVQVKAIGLNRGELKLLTMMPEGWRPGFDIAGTVVSSSVNSSFPVGSRIMGFAQKDGWSEFVAISTDRIALLPDAISFEEGAALPMVGLTGLQSVKQVGNIKNKEVLLTAGRGGVGSIQLLAATLQQARVTAISSHAQQLQKDYPNVTWIENLDKSDRMYDVILDGIGGSMLSKAITVAAPGATIINFGNTSGQPTPISYFDIMNGHNGLTIIFFDVTVTTEKLQEVVSLAEMVTSPLDVVSYSWLHIDKALARLGGREGKKIVCVID